MSREEIFNAALALSSDDRAVLADCLLESLCAQSLREKWIAEAESRIEAYENGEMPTYSSDEVMAEARSRSFRC